MTSFQRNDNELAKVSHTDTMKDPKKKFILKTTCLNTIDAYIKAHTGEMFKRLAERVLIQSSSHNKAGLDKVAALIAATFKSNGVGCETVKQASSENHLIVTTGASRFFSSATWTRSSRRIPPSTGIRKIKQAAV